MAKVIRKMYLHNDSDSNYDLADELGMDDDATNNFKYNLYEVEFIMEIDTETGDSVILKVDGVEIRKPSPPDDEDVKEKDEYLKRLGVK